MEAKVYKPLAKVTFYTENGGLVARATNNPKSALDDDVVSITTDRDMQNDSPTFTIELTRRKPWHKWVASNDLIIIEMCRPPESSRKVFFGLVDDCRKKISIYDSTPQRVITVTGRGMAKAMVEFDVGVVPEAEYQSTSVGWLEAAGIVLAGSTPSKIAKAVWDVICKKHINYKWSNGKSLFDYVKTSFSDRKDLILLDSSSIMNWEGSIQALLKSVAEDPFYELFWEVIDDKPTLVIRPTPFNKTPWNKLTTFHITDNDILNEELGRSDVETYSIFSVGASSLFSPYDTYKTFGVLPYWNEKYAKKYGNHRLHVETSYISVADGSDTDSQTDTMKGMMKDLYNWNIMNNRMLNGTIIVRGSNRFRIGCRLSYSSDEDGSLYEYYITSVSHSFVNNDKWITILGVTRGLKPADRFKDPWGTYKQYSGMGIVPFDPIASRNAMKTDYEKALSVTGGVDFVTSSKVVSAAKNIMNHGINGVPVKYTFGGNDPYAGRLDCSSFVQFVFQHYANMDLGRTTAQQVKKGTKITKSEALPGDLIFFKGTYNSGYVYGVSHVGIYIGDGQFISNTSSGNVKIDDVSNPYWSAHFLMFRRVLLDNDSGDTSGGGWSTYSATAYGASALNVGGGAGYIPTWKTATGTTPKEGRTIAVDKSVIPLYSKVQIVCDSYPSINGTYIAEDVGGAIKGKKIDIYFDDSKDPYAARQRMLKFGKRKIKVKILRKGKG